MMSELAAPLAIVEGILPSGTCYDAAHVGTYGSLNLYTPILECNQAQQAAFNQLESVSVKHVMLPEDTVQLVVVTEVALEPELLEMYKSTNVDWEQVEAMAADTLWKGAKTEGNAQEVLHGSSSQQVPNDREFPFDLPTIVYASESSSVLAVSRSSLLVAQRFLDASLAPHKKLYAIPYPPSPLVPVPSKDVERVQVLLDNLKYNHSIARLVNVLSVAQMNLDIAWLTGEARGSPLESRHSFHRDTLKAAHWIKDRIEATGAKCRLSPFSEGFAPNIVCRYDGAEDTDELVLLSAHYDSRGSFGSTRAPGGDDDGSGTTSILSIARAIGTTGIKFKKNVELCLFAGEEQGLVGSSAYARELRKQDADIILMIQADMLAYHKPGEPPQIGLPDRIGTPEATQLVANVSALYSPELEVGFTPACCSDHQSFHEQGFAATQIFERAGPIADPMYHNSGDLSRRVGYDFWQLRSIAKVQFATLLHAAGFEI